MKPIRIFIRSVRDSFKNVTRNFSLALASILCVTITLIIVAVAVLISANTINATKSIEHEMNIVVYLQKDATEEDLENLNAEIKAMEEVNKTEVVTKAVEKENLASSSDMFETILNYLDENPLLDAIIVYTNDITEIKTVSETLETLPKVESVKYNEGVVSEIIATFEIVEYVTAGILIALLFVTVFLISNTIKLTVYSRQDEIGIMRLIGASNSTIELPFIFEGLIIGVVGAIIPICVTVYGYVILYNTMGGHLFSEMLPLVQPGMLVTIVSLLVLVLGALVGMFGSFISVRKYLKI